MNELKFPLIPMHQIRSEVREIAVQWAGSAGMEWIGDKHKLASDIQNYSDWLYQNRISKIKIQMSRRCDKDDNSDFMVGYLMACNDLEQHIKDNDN